jgi:membrane protein
LLVYWTAITLGPLLLGASLTMTSYVISSSKDVVGSMPGGLRFLLDTLEFAMVAGGMAATYYFVPNTQVKWRHAWLGGLFASAGIELAKKLLAFYLGLVPTYSVVYGAFATVPILLIWIYVAWVIVLLGAVITAYLPSLLEGVRRRISAHGGQFQLSLEVLQQLYLCRQTPEKGKTASDLAQRLKVDGLQLEPVMEALAGLDWVQLLQDEDEPNRRYVLLADPDNTPLAPLLERLLLERTPAVEALWKSTGLPTLMLRQVL